MYTDDVCKPPSQSTQIAPSRTGYVVTGQTTRASNNRIPPPLARRVFPQGVVAFPFALPEFEIIEITPIFRCFFPLLVADAQRIISGTFRISKSPCSQPLHLPLNTPGVLLGRERALSSTPPSQSWLKCWHVVFAFPLKETPISTCHGSALISPNISSPRYLH